MKKFTGSCFTTDVHFPGKWHAIRNKSSKETEYLSNFCSLKIPFKWCFCYNLSTSKRGQGINFWGSSQVLWVFPRNVTKDQKSYENLLTAAKETRPFAMHCKKDMLEWLRVPRSRWPFAIISIATQKRKKNRKIANVLTIFHYWRSCTHSWEGLKMCYFKAFICVKNALYSSAVVTRASRAPIF